MSRLNHFFASRWGPILAGATVGVLAPILVKLGNPGNMGICVACFTRDVAGAVGLQRVATVEYLRPEIAGLVLGALIAALVFHEWKPRAGSTPVVRFVLGIFAMIGALVFLGCPWRAWLRLGGGDWNAIAGLVGLAAGVAVGIVFLRQGFSLGRTRPAPTAAGWVMPVLMIGMLLLLMLAPQFGRDADGKLTGPVFFSTTGPGSQHAPAVIALVIAIVIGFVAQRSRFCTIGGLRDLMLMRDTYLFFGSVALVVAAVVTNLALGQFNPGFDKQPIAHTDALWNFGGMVLSGLAFTLAGGCPGRQLILSGEGDTDAAVFWLGMLVGAGFAHNFNLASSAAGPSPYGPAAVIVGLVVCIAIGWTLRERIAAVVPGAATATGE